MKDGLVDKETYLSWDLVTSNHGWTERHALQVPRHRWIHTESFVQTSHHVRESSRDVLKVDFCFRAHGGSYFLDDLLQCTRGFEEPEGHAGEQRRRGFAARDDQDVRIGLEFRLVEFVFISTMA